MSSDAYAQETKVDLAAATEKTGSDSDSNSTVGRIRDGVVLGDIHDPSFKQVQRKIDWRLLPILTLLYLLSFLDRANVGNAKIEGLTTSLNIVGANYNTGLALYFVGYCIFEVPANMVLKRVSPNFWLPFITMVFAIVSICQGLVHNQAGFFAVRFFLGVAEAGLFPGVVYIFSLYYPRKDRHYRVSLFFSGAAVSGAFGGILAYGIGKMNGIGGKPGWAWIFIIEGLVTFVVSIIAFFIVPGNPNDATFLTKEEKHILLEGLKADSDAADAEPFNWRGIRQALTDPFVYGYALLFHFNAFGLYTVSLFLPTIIAGLGYQSWQAQLLTVPPYALAFLETMFVAWASHKVDRRAPFIVGSVVIGVVGYILLISLPHNSGVSYFGTFLITFAIYPISAVTLSWPSENVSSQTKRAVALAMQISLGDTAALTGTLIYRPEWSSNVYRKPNIIALGYLFFSGVTAAGLWYFLGRENRRRGLDGAKKVESEEVGTASAEVRGEARNSEEVEERRLLGDRHQSWRYQT